MMERLTVSDRNPPRENLPEKTHQPLKFRILTLGETLLKSDREILGIKESREVRINRSDLPYKKIMLMKERK
jgi:hypothetical protein